VFAAYCEGHPGAIALGGRYDQVGRFFGRGRPATGFSMDLREIARLSPEPAGPAPILAPCANDPALLAAIERLRAAGEIVVVELPGHEGCWLETGCDRTLVPRGGQWQLEPIQGGNRSNG
jgi:ATP phosphoribosyltransferase regulatory subunit